MLSVIKLADAEYPLGQVALGIEDYYLGMGEAPGVWAGTVGAQARPGGCGRGRRPAGPGQRRRSAGWDVVAGGTAGSEGERV